ncbi:MAG: CD225/dispanin family protein [Deltaproteobacteria bacterium]|nr:CD225/dispanin family protein [Candidatus Zymogenaceae bacterium]
MGTTEIEPAQNTPAEEKEPRLPTGDNAQVEGYMPNYLAPAIIVMIFCCFPLGIVGLIYSTRVNGLLIAKEYDNARTASRNARMWCWITFAVGIVFWSMYVVLYMVIIGFLVLADSL